MPRVRLHQPWFSEQYKVRSKIIQQRTHCAIHKDTFSLACSTVTKKQKYILKRQPLPTIRSVGVVVYCLVTDPGERYDFGGNMQYEKSSRSEIKLYSESPADGQGTTFERQPTEGGRQKLKRKCRTFGVNLGLPDIKTTASLPSSKSTFSQHSKEKCILNDVVRISTITIFQSE